MEWEWNPSRCIVPAEDGSDCQVPAVAYWMCATHYQRARRGSDLSGRLGKGARKLTVRATNGLAERVLEAATEAGVSESRWMREVLEAALPESGGSSE